MRTTACNRRASNSTGGGASRWPLERVLFALAGSVTLAGAALAALVSPWFLLLSALVGINQWLYVLLGACPASFVLTRQFSLRSVLYPRRAEGP
jgi:Zn-dependent protease